MYVLMIAGWFVDCVMVVAGCCCCWWVSERRCRCCVYKVALLGCRRVMYSFSGVVIGSKKSCGNGSIFPCVSSTSPVDWWPSCTASSILERRAGKKSVDFNKKNWRVETGRKIQSNPLFSCCLFLYFSNPGVSPCLYLSTHVSIHLRCLVGISFNFNVLDLKVNSSSHEANLSLCSAHPLPIFSRKVSTVMPPILSLKQCNHELIIGQSSQNGKKKLNVVWACIFDHLQPTNEKMGNGQWAIDKTSWHPKSVSR